MEDLSRAVEDAEEEEDAGNSTVVFYDNLHLSPIKVRRAAPPHHVLSRARVVRLSRLALIV